MVQYECKLCCYITLDQSNFMKHKKSVKHTKKENDLNNSTNKIQKESKKNPNSDSKYTCEYCEKNYTTPSNLSKHKKKCINKQTVIIQLENDKKAQETHYLKEIIKRLENENKKLEEDKRHYKKLVEGAGILAKTSMSTLSYVMSTYKDAPALDKMENYACIQYDGKNKKINLYDMMFTHQDKGTLHTYLGDFLIDVYKKDNPEDQSLWISDTSRLTYIIRELIDKTPDWNVDKKGVKTTTYIIEPFLEYTREILDKYNKKNDLKNHLDDSIFQMKQRIENLKMSTHIIFDIKNNELGPKILKYIAPYFHLTKIKMSSDKNESESE